MKKFFKKKLVKIVCFALACVTVLGILGGVTASVTNDTKKISASVFSRGGLNEVGEYVATNKTLYTEEAFACKGLRIEPNFESNVTYDVYYYDFDGDLLAVEKGLKKIYDVDCPFAKTCRVVIHPTIPADVSEKDYEIGFFDVYDIAKSLKITVDKNQEYLYSESDNYYDESTCTQGVKLAFTKTDNGNGIDVFVSTETDANFKTTDKISVAELDFEKFDIFVRSKTKLDKNTVGIVASSANVVKYSADFDLSSAKVDEWCKLTLVVDKLQGAEYIQVSLPVDAECFIYGYN